MASFVNVGARDISTNAVFKTKKELKDRIAVYPQTVEFYATSDFTPFGDTADNLEIGVKYSVVGPNPYTNRVWYATVEKLANGTIRVS